jgi:hypothetical protein
MGTRIFNILSIIFLVLSVVWIIYVVSQLMGPPAAEREDVITLPTPLVLPTLTPSNTPIPTSTPTDTLTPTITLSPTDVPTETPVPSLTATITDTPGASSTPSDTPTPPETFTPTPTETPSGPTATFTATTSPFPFDLRENQVIFTQNFANTAGCAWQGIGGQVFDLSGNPLPGLQVHVYGGDIDRFIQSGANTLYGPAGWEQQVANAINTNRYYVELVTSQGTTVSPRVEVTFPSDCARNLALVNFIQTRPL